MDDRHAAAQRDGLAPYRPCARRDAAGHADPPRPAQGQGRALGRRHGPCRHRHPDGGRAAAERAPAEAHRFHPRGIHRQGLGMEGRKRRRDHPPAAAARRLVRLGERALHHGRGLQPRRAQGVRRPLQPEAALSRQAAGELGPGPQDRDLRPRGRDQRDQFAFLAFLPIRSRTARARSRSRRRGPRRCSPTWRWRCIPRTRATRR